ncbi:MAG: DUF2332 family protein [Pseudomonadota bacterium]
MTPVLANAFEDQARACGQLGSPFMAKTLPLMLRAALNVPQLADQLQGIPQGRLAPTADATALRLAAGFHQIVLDGHGLAAAYPPHAWDEQGLYAALCQAAQDQPKILANALLSPPQTNEIRRSAVLIAVGHWLTARFGKMLVLSELGCSAGLNLNWDFYRMTAAGLEFGPQASAVHLKPDWRGTAPTLCPAYVHAAQGVDLNPPDITTTHGQTKLLSYLWPDQPDRLTLTRAGLDISTRPDTESHGQVVKGDALDWLPERLSPKGPYLHLIYSTIAWQYLPPKAQQKGHDMITSAGALATQDAPLAWFQMEGDTDHDSAALTLRLWPGDITIPMGRADYHGRWIDWCAPVP